MPAIMRGKVPSMAEINGLQLVDIEEDCNLTELENNLIALNLNFQYIFCLKKSRWGATKNQMISVPVGPNTVISTVQKLPRLPSEAGLIPVQLKRKKEYQRCHKKELVDPEKIIRAINLLMKSGHPYYQFLADIASYEQRCKDNDERGYQLLFGIHDSEDDGQRIDTENTDIDDESEKEGATKDTIRKYQFDHNRNTAMTHNYPEAEVDENGRRLTNQEELSFAPAEGNYPTNLLEEKDWDIKSWPILHPDGRFGIHHKRKHKLTEQQYFGQRILNEDLRFSKSPGYLFAAAAYIEKKQLMSKANISFMRGKKSVNKEGTTQYDLDDAFTTFDGVTNTPKYWQKVKFDMIARLENIGPFHLFFTLSCGDTRYEENFSTFLAQNGYKMEHTYKLDCTTETRVISKETLAKILKLSLGKM